MNLEGMVGHKMGPAAISENSDFPIIAAFYVQKSPFCQYLNQEPFDGFCSFFIKMSQIANRISTFSYLIFMIFA